MTNTTLGGLDTGEAVIEDKDVVGMSFAVLESSIYPFFIEEAFLEKAASGALGVHMTFKENQDGTGKVLEKTIYIQSGDEKGNKSYYVDRDGEQQTLPGYILMDTLCEIITGKKLKTMTTTKMAAMVYDADAKERVTTQVDMLKVLCGKPVYVAVLKQITDKRVKGDDGTYHATGEKREDNDIAKFFRAADKKSVTEGVANNSEPAAYYHKWLEQWEGKTRDRSSNKGAAAPAGAAAGPGVKNMFAKKS